MDFEVVPDTERASTDNRYGPTPSPLAEAVISGKTVFVATTQRRPKTMIGPVGLQRRGLRLRELKTVRDGVAGYIVWAEPRANGTAE